MWIPIQWLSRTTQGGKTNRDIVVVLLGHGFRLGLGLLSSALLARGLGPDGFRIVVVIGSALSILSTVADLGLSNSAIRFISSEEEGDLELAYRTSWIYSRLKVVSGAVVSLSILLFSGIFLGVLNISPAEGRLIPLIAGLGLLARSFSSLISTIFQALRRFSQIVATQSLEIVLTVGMIGSLFLAGSLQVQSGLMAGVIALAAASLLGFVLLPRGWKVSLARPGLWDTRIAGRLWRFGRWVWVSMLLSNLYYQVDLLALNLISDPDLTGIYSVGFNLSLRAGILFQTLYVVLLPEAAALKSARAARVFLRQSSRRSVVLALIVLGSILISWPFITLIYGEVYRQAVGVYDILAISVILDLVTLPVVLLAYPLDRPWLLMLQNMIRILVFAIGFSVWYPVLSIFGVALAKLVANIIALAPVIYYVLVRLGPKGEPWELNP